MPYCTIVPKLRIASAQEATALGKKLDGGFFGINTKTRPKPGF